MTKQFYYLLLIFSLVLVSACREVKKGEGMGKFGMMDSNTPEYAAIKFFDHLYHDKNLNSVMIYASPSLARLLKSYKTNRNVQRHVVNLKYDKVEIRPDSGSSFGRNEFADEVELTLFFTGMYYEDKIEDIRVIDLVKVDDKWKVNKIHPDKFL